MSDDLAGRKPFVFSKNTLAQCVTLYHGSYTEFEQATYLNESDCSDHPGWTSAPDDKYAAGSTYMKRAFEYKANVCKAADYDTTKEQYNEYTGPNYDAKAPYGLWALHALYSIKYKLASHCYLLKTPTGIKTSTGFVSRDVIYEQFRQLMDDVIQGNCTRFEIRGLSPGTMSEMLMSTALYLGNSAHEDKQIAEQLEL